MVTYSQSQIDDALATIATLEALAAEQRATIAEKRATVAELEAEVATLEEKLRASPQNASKPPAPKMRQSC